ncbi:MAG: CopG family transcriptional regulator [Candidatus Binatia bacterium]
MVRTQIYLSEEQHAALQHAAERNGISMTEELRRLIDRHLLAKGADPLRDRETYFTFVGIGESGAADVAERHDDYLAEAYRGANRGAPPIR